jgi:hypothetical protein
MILRGWHIVPSEVLNFDNVSAHPNFPREYVSLASSSFVHSFVLILTRHKWSELKEVCKKYDDCYLTGGRVASLRQPSQAMIVVALHLATVCQLCFID